MIDRWARSAYAPAVERAATVLHGRGVSPDQVTGFGLLIGLAGCVLVAVGQPVVGVVLFLTNRIIDGIDGPLARRGHASPLGPQLDFLADHLIYEGFVVALAIARPEARLALAVLLATYTINTVSLLSIGPVLERLGGADADDRGMLLPTGLVEGAETMAAYTVMALMVSWTEALAWVFAGLVAFTALGRVLNAQRLVRAAPDRPTARSG